MCRTWVGKSRGGIERVRLGYGPTNPLAILSTFIPCLQRFATRKTRASINNLNSIYVPPPPPGPHVLIKNPRGVSDYRQNSSYFIANSSAAIVPALIKCCLQNQIWSWRRVFVLAKKSAKTLSEGLEKWDKFGLLTEPTLTPSSRNKKEMIFKHF